MKSLMRIVLVLNRRLMLGAVEVVNAQVFYILIIIMLIVCV